MKLNLDSQAITLTCPECSQKFDEKIGRLKNNPTLICPKCKVPITINAANLRSAIQSAQKSLDSLTRKIRSFGK